MHNSLPKTDHENRPAPFAPVLALRPFAVETYTDLQRGRQIVRLCYRRRDAAQSKALSFVADVIADLTRAGLVVAGEIESGLSLDNTEGKGEGKRRVLQTPGTHCGCHLRIPVQPLDAAPEEWAEWVRALQASGGGGAGADEPGDK